MKSFLRPVGLFQCAGGSGFVRMNAGVMFAWLTRCRGIENSCGCLSWVAVVWEGFDSFLFPCVRGGSVSTPGPGSRVCGRSFVVQQTRRQCVSLGAVLQNTATEQRDFTNKQNTASTCVFLLSLCFHMLLWSFHSLFSHLFRCFSFIFPSFPCVWLCPHSVIPL